MEYPPKITKALHAVMTKVGYVQKRGENKFHGYKYAGEADLLEVLRPAMLEAGLLLIPSGAEHAAIDEHGNTHVSVAYTLAHKDGDVWPDKIIAFGSGNDRNKNGVGDKGTYKALTGANKYLLFKLFQIETGDDPEATEAAKVSPHDDPAEAVGKYMGVTAIKAEIGAMIEHVNNARSPEELETLKLGYEHKHNGEPSLMERAEKLPKTWPKRVSEVFAEKGAELAGQPDLNPMDAG